MEWAKKGSSEQIKEYWRRIQKTQGWKIKQKKSDCRRKLQKEMDTGTFKSGKSLEDKEFKNEKDPTEDWQNTPGNIAIKSLRTLICILI